MPITLKALFCLLAYDLRLAVGGFPALYVHVRTRRVRANPMVGVDSDRVCQAVAQACSWYPKRALCLQRSAVLVNLLRRSGVSADLVIGAGAMPFKAHAWVELNGLILNDKPSVRNRYVVIDRC